MLTETLPQSDVPDTSKDQNNSYALGLGEVQVTALGGALGELGVTSSIIDAGDIAVANTGQEDNCKGTKAIDCSRGDCGQFF